MPLQFRADTPEDADFRAEFRGWLDARAAGRMARLGDVPAEGRRPGVAQEAARRRLPRAALAEEMGRLGAQLHSADHHPGGDGARAGARIVGPGAEPHRPDHHAVRQRRAEETSPEDRHRRKCWCQGYSEPNSGSDLTSLRTKAAIDGDHFVVNGQKIWTTWAHDADWIFMLVRTDPDAKPQAGISFILADMKTTGIRRARIRPSPATTSWPSLPRRRARAGAN